MRHRILRHRPPAIDRRRSAETLAPAPGQRLRLPRLGVRLSSDRGAYGAVQPVRQELQNRHAVSGPGVALIRRKRAVECALEADPAASRVDDTDCGDRVRPWRLCLFKDPLSVATLITIALITVVPVIALL